MVYRENHDTLVFRKLLCKSVKVKKQIGTTLSNPNKNNTFIFLKLLEENDLDVINKNELHM